MLTLCSNIFPEGWNLPVYSMTQEVPLSDMPSSPSKGQGRIWIEIQGTALTHYLLKTEGDAMENNQPARSRERKNIYMQRFTPADWRMKCRKASNTSSKSVNSTRLHSANHTNADAGFHTVRELWMNIERGQQVQRNHTMGDTQRK